MRKDCLKIIALAAVVIAALSCTAQVNEKEPVDYVNPYIGNISHLLQPTYTTVQLPNSMLRITPNRGDYTSELLHGFPLLQPGHRGDKVFTVSVSHSVPSAAVVSVRYDHEKVTPYSYDVDIDDCLTHVSFAPSHQSAMYEVTSEVDGPLVLTISSEDGEIKAEGNSLSGSHSLGKTTAYFYMEALEKPSATVSPSESTVSLTFAEKDVHIRYGVSYISSEQALANLRREMDGWDVGTIAAEGRRIWNETLGRMKIEGGTEDERTVFYTSYWRTLERPMCLSEDGHYWSANDSRVYEDGGVPFYTDDWSWDTFRAAHPLRILMDQKLEENILESYLRMADQDPCGWIPTFPGVCGDSPTMNCNHHIISYADALAKGLDVDLDRACYHSVKTLREKTLVPWTRGAFTKLDTFYWEKGYFPALAPGEKEDVPTVGWENRQPVPVTLGTSYDCWAASKLSEAAGRSEDAEYFAQKALNYRNIFNAETGFFHPKDAYGKFIPDFDYAFCGGPGGREYYDENNGWVYRWEVQHNIPDLISMMGGAGPFVAALDSMFATPIDMGKYEFYAKYPDHTGNVGQFSMANEPAFHIPYLYNYAGAPWKTQKRIRQLLDTWYRNDLMGVPGDEDGGGMTAFVVFSQLGFYPVTPGTTEYSIGSPVFPRAEMKLSNGNTFTVIAEGASADNKYIQSATLDGKSLDRPVLTHDAIIRGGCLKLVMGPRPNKNWGH